ncbi:MAG: response regulator [Blautia sp.]
MRILISEDNDLNAEILEELLDVEEINSERAINGQQAVKMILENPAGYYDAVLMDIQMPVMDGCEAARIIRSLDRPDEGELPIVAVTANAFTEDIRNVLQSGMDAHVAKPVDMNVLKNTLQNVIKRGKIHEKFL